MTHMVRGNVEMMDSHDRSDRADESRGGRPEAVAPPGPSDDLPVSRLARTILVTALLGYALHATIGILGAGMSPTAEATSLLLLLPILALQLLHSTPGNNQAPLHRTCLTLTL
ncbi:hypothetical protein AB0I23_40050, partial [Streptomyces atratus]